MKLGIAYDSIALDHDTGAGHPERPDRLRVVLQALERLDFPIITPRDATIEECQAAHDPAYLESVRQAIESGILNLDPDTVVCQRSWKAALRAAGAGLTLCEAIRRGDMEAGFACVRPPGHHATRNRAMGFCLINNVAVSARYLRKQGHSVAILDWDVHHGNGTIDIFADDPDVPVWNLRQEGLWPVPGEIGPLPDHIIDIPMPLGSGDSAYLQAFRDGIVPAIRAHDPEFLLLSAGFDAHRDDPLAGQTLSTEAYGELTRCLAGPRHIVSFLEGGYDLCALADSVVIHLETLSEL